MKKPNWVQVILHIGFLLLYSVFIVIVITGSIKYTFISIVGLLVIMLPLPKLLYKSKNKEENIK